MTIAATELTDEVEPIQPPELGALERRHELGQFLTPEPVADFMASLFETPWRELNLLDAGAGGGALSAALVRSLCTAARKPKAISITAYEIDSTMIEPLRVTMAGCQRDCARAGIQFTATVLHEDFIQAAVPMVWQELFAPPAPSFDDAIVIPPYRQIRRGSPAGLALRSTGRETSNDYLGFVALIVRLLGLGGGSVALPTGGV